MLIFKNNQSPDFFIGNFFSDGGFQIRSDNKTFLTVGANDGDTTAISGSLNVTGISGHITASGNISASGVIISSKYEFGYGGSAAYLVPTISESNLSEVRVAGHITASGNISSSATITANALNIKGGAGTEDFFLNSNVFTDADHSKLDAIEASADVTDTTNVTAAGALMDSELTDEAAIKAIDQGLTTTSNVQFASITVTSLTSSIVTASIVQTHGSNIFGDATSDTHNFTGNVTASGNISASKIYATKFHAPIGVNDGYHIGDGKPILAIAPAAQGGALRLGAGHPTYNASGVHIFVTGSDVTKGLFLDSVGNVTSSGNISSSGTVTANALSVKGGVGTDDFFLIRSGSFDAIKTNSEGVMVLGAFTFTPTARAGGFYYDNSDDEFYLGKAN